MKRYILNWTPGIFLVVFISLLGISCQKSFDPNSYMPEQIFNGYSSSDQVAATNLVAYWSFDDNLLDSVSNTSGTSVGTGFSAGIKGKAMQGALNSYVLFTNTTQIKSVQSFTIAYWVNTAYNSVGIQTPVDFVNPDQFWGNFDNFFDGQTATEAKYKFHLFGGSDRKTDAWLGDNWKLTNPWGHWLNIALTYDMGAGVFTFYLNGVKFGSASSPKDFPADFGVPSFTESTTIIFGTVQFQTVPSSTTATDAQPWASYLTGALDEVKMFNTALPVADINALYQLQNLGK